jgi:arginyl-tRNA synthetase
VKEHPHFGDVAEIYNVIDARQAEAQNAVIEALRGLGYLAQADHYTHLSYEMVALTPACAIQLGYRLSDEDRTRPFLEVSGRKGFGVKADDLIDTLIAATRKEVDGRHPEVTEAERATLAAEIAIGALRFFKEALSFEGETGPYVQYAVVRAANILRKAGLDPEENFAQADDYGRYLTGSEGTEVWELWLAAGKTSYVIDQSIATAEPAYLARHAFQLAQRFNSFYHRFPVLNEAEEGRKKFLLATVIVVRRELKRVLAVMGIAVPALM